ncbi:MAG: methyltransferase [Symploca sp. SIO2G7]|nr:methyltransferase [Symploca sp. SIO2G7]
MANSYDRIYAVVRQIPWGKVATYGQVAELAGLIGKPRVVGYALYKVAPEDDIPWQRVINAKGEISTSVFRDGSDDLQRVLLEEEGIEFEGNKINLANYRWQPSAEMINAIDFGENKQENDP